LKQETSIPVLGQRQGKTDAVCHAVGPGSPVDDSVKPAVSRQVDRGPSASWDNLRRAGRDSFRFLNGQRRARHLQVHQCGALVGRRSHLCQDRTAQET
jgi:hypothetical protein